MPQAEALKSKRKQPIQLGTHGVSPPNKLTGIPWDEIKGLVESGQSMCKVAKQYAGLHSNGYEGLLEVIKKRAQRSMWVVPKTAMARARQKLQEMGVSVPTPSQEVAERIEKAKDGRDRVGTALVESLDEMGQEGSLIAAKLSLDLLRGARDNPERIAPIVDSKDIATNLKVVRTAAGMDRQAAPVSFNLFGGPMSQPVSRDITGDIRDVAGSSLQEWTDDE